jgi:hypothetical protein
LGHANLGNSGRIEGDECPNRRAENGSGDNGQQGSPLGQESRYRQMEGETNWCPGEFVQTFDQAFGPGDRLAASLHTVSLKERGIIPGVIRANPVHSVTGTAFDNAVSEK